METSAGTISKMTTPHDKTLRDVFAINRAYHIDIYQREYKWDKVQVETLINDMNLYFDQRKIESTTFKDIQAEVRLRFDSYFLNTYLTHTTGFQTNLVDGQQRLTTILLILLSLRNIIQDANKDPGVGKTFSAKMLEGLIFETDDAGEMVRFKITNNNRETALRSIANNAVIDPVDETQQRLIDNYTYINERYQAYFRTEGGKYDTTKLNAYVTYLLDKISIVELTIEKSNNVAMVFEVLNDRGLSLQPYEILKGKFLGGLQPAQKEDADKSWTRLQNDYFETIILNSSDKRIDLDYFFRAWLRAKFANTEDQYKSFEGKYQYVVYKREDISRYFGNFRDANQLYTIVKKEIVFYANIYRKLRADYSIEPLFWNKLMDQNQQYMLILAALSHDDNEDIVKEKINIISKKYDQIHVILRLLGMYGSNSFQRIVYRLLPRIRDKAAQDCRNEFDSVLLEFLVQAEFIDKDFTGGVSALFTFDRFNSVSNDDRSFSKYILWRIDRWLAGVLGLPSFCTDGDLVNQETLFNRSNKKDLALHLEHIFTNASENKELFLNKENGAIDESKFNIARNMLGMVLLLKDRHNLSSGKELYKNKVATYKKSKIIWNDLLVDNIPEIDKKKLPMDFLKFSPFCPSDKGIFPKNRIRDRQEMLFLAIKEIWSNV